MMIISWTTGSSIVLMISLFLGKATNTTAFYQKKEKESNDGRNHGMLGSLPEYSTTTGSGVVGGIDYSMAPLSSPSVLPPSPRCWISAIGFFQQAQQADAGEDAQQLCATLPEEHQKWLALEIARCHVQDLGKKLILNEDDDHIEGQCNAPSQDAETLHLCLRHLTDAGAAAYTHYVSYVHQLCIRLTQELLVHQQHDRHKEMVSKYADLTNKSVEQLEVVQELAAKHTDQMNVLAAIPNQIREQLTLELRAQLKETLKASVKEQIQDQLGVQLKEQLEDRLSPLLQQQVTAQAAYLDRIMNEIEQRDSEHKNLFDTWTHYQTTLWQSQAREMEQQRIKMEKQGEKLETHRSQVQQLSDTVTATTKNMQPLLGLESLVMAATHGYTWVTFLLHFLATFNVIWLFTRPVRCQSFRPYLYIVVFLEAVLEIALAAVKQHGWIADSHRINLITELRRWALFLECGLYLIGMVLAFLWPVGRTEEASQLRLQRNRPASLEDAHCRCPQNPNGTASQTSLERRVEYPSVVQPTTLARTYHQQATGVAPHQNRLEPPHHPGLVLTHGYLPPFPYETRSHSLPPAVYDPAGPQPPSHLVSSWPDGRWVRGSNGYYQPNPHYSLHYSASATPSCQQMGPSMNPTLSEGPQTAASAAGLYHHGAAEFQGSQARQSRPPPTPSEVSTTGEIMNRSNEKTNPSLSLESAAVSRIGDQKTTAVSTSLENDNSGRKRQAVTLPEGEPNTKKAHRSA